MNENDFTATQTEALTSVFSKIEAGQFDPNDIKSEFTNILESQMKWSKGNYDKKQTQIKSYEQILGELGYDPEKYENKQDFTTSVKNQQKELEMTKSEKETLRERIARLEALEKDRVEELTKTKAINDRNTVTKTLTESIDNKLQGRKLQASTYVINDLINTGSAKVIDGEVMGVINGEVVPLDKLIDQVIEKNNDLILTTQIAGAGSFKTNNKAQGTLTLDQINKMTPDQIKANLSEIKKMAGMR